MHTRRFFLSLLIVFTSFSLLGQPVNLWELDDYKFDSIDLSDLRTYEPHELDSLLDEYISTLPVKDTFPLFELIDSLKLGDYYNFINFDSIIQQINWNEVTKLIDWNAALRGYNWDEMVSALCNTNDTSFAILPLHIDLQADSTKKRNAFFANKDLMSCFQMEKNELMVHMMKGINLECILRYQKELTNMSSGSGLFDDAIKKMNGQTNTESPDLELLCKLSECINMNVVFENMNWNCVFEGFDFNSILKNWKMQDWMDQLKSVPLSKGDSFVKKQMGGHPIFGKMNADSLKHHMGVAFNNFFDAKNTTVINQNFYNRIFEDNLNNGNPRNMLKLVTPLMADLVGDQKTADYFTTFLWLFQEIRESVKLLDYESLYKKGLLLRDVYIYMIQSKQMTEVLSKNQLDFLTNEDRRWVLFATIEDILATALSELGRFSEALEHYKYALAFNYKSSIKIDPSFVEKQYLSFHFSNVERESLMNRYNLSIETFHLNQDNLWMLKHPEVITKHLKKKEYKEALEIYLLLKDILISLGKEGKVISNYNLPLPMADKPFELIYLKHIFQLMTKVMEEANWDTNTAYEEYCSAGHYLDQYQQSQKLIALENSVGTFHYQLQNYELSRQYLLKAWNGLKEFGSLDYFIAGVPGLSKESDYLNKLPIYSTVISNLSQVYITMQDYDQAIDLLQNALLYVDTIHQKELEAFPFKANSMNLEDGRFEIYKTLTHLYLIKNDNEKVILYLNKCDSIVKATNIPMRQYFVANFFGVYHNNRSEFQLATQYWQKAKEIATQLDYPGFIAATYGLLGNVKVQNGELIQAFAYYDSCETIAQTKSLYGILSEVNTRKANLCILQNQLTKAFKFYKKSIDLIEDSILINSLGANSRQLVIENGFSAYEGAIVTSLQLKQYEKAFQYVQQVKSRTLNEGLTTVALGSNKIPVTLKRERQDILAQLTKIQHLATIHPDSLKIINQRKQLVDQLKTINARIQTASSEFSQLTNPELATINKIQKELKKDQLFVEYFAGSSMYAFVITPDSFEIINLGKTSVILKQAYLFNNAMNKITPKLLGDKLGYKIHLEKVENIRAELSALLIRPLLQDKLDYKEFVIAPDALIYTVPFEQLYSTVKKDNYLLEHFTISYTSSATTFRYQKQQPKKPNTKDIFVLAKSEYPNYPNLSNLSTLKTSIISDHFDLEKQDYLLETDARLMNLQLKNLQDYRYLYFDTHAIINETPELSYLPLTESQLSMFNTFDLNLNSDLLILSACQTGQGHFRRGGGVIGFARGLMYAGNRSVILSQWPVEYQSTNQLFDYFFEDLATGKTPKESLRSAKLQLMQSNKTYQDPFYWAPFVLIGE